jgi:hypothetical protein
MHHEPTITEEAAATVSRSVRNSQSQGASGSKNGGGSLNGAIKEKVAKSRMVGDWQLQKTLGAGSMGKVKLATHVHTRERVSDGNLHGDSANKIHVFRLGLFPLAVDTTHRITVFRFRE